MNLCFYGINIRLYFIDKFMTFVFFFFFIFSNYKRYLAKYECMGCAEHMKVWNSLQRVSNGNASFKNDV